MQRTLTSAGRGDRVRLLDRCLIRSSNTFGSFFAGCNQTGGWCFYGNRRAPGCLLKARRIPPGIIFVWAEERRADRPFNWSKTSFKKARRCRSSSFNIYSHQRLEPEALREQEIVTVTKQRSFGTRIEPVWTLKLLRLRAPRPYLPFTSHLCSLFNYNITQPT